MIRTLIPMGLTALLSVAIWLMVTSNSSAPAHNLVRAENQKLEEENIAIQETGDDGMLDMKAQGTVDSSLKDAVTHFLEAADHGDVATIASTYEPDFMCVRVADEGGFVQLTREQMLGFWKNAIGNAAGGSPVALSIPTQKTTIHFAEVVGDTGYVLLTRIKNIGNGWEPMFYNLVWKRQGANWRLLREFVHQKSVPKQIPK